MVVSVSHFIRSSLVRVPFFALSTLSIMMGTAHSAMLKTATTEQSTLDNVTQQVFVSDNEKLSQCAKVSEDIARLACYDKVLAGDTSLNQKVPLDLSKTVNASIEEGKVAPVLVTGERVEVNKDVVLQSIKANPTLTIATPPQETIDNKEQDKQILQAVGVTKDDTKSYSALSRLYDLDRNDPKGVFTLRPHYQTYVLPIFASKSPNETPHSPSQPVPDNYPDLQHVDSKFQVSIKTKVVEDLFHTNADLWFGYTQQSYWQVYNESESRPFRVSDYQPEIFVTQPAKYDLPFNGDLRMIGAGLVHESNGQSDPLSRSWNRGYLIGGMEWGKLTVVPRVWFIFPNFKEHEDNKDIGDYMGYGDVRWQYPLSNKDTVGGLVRFNPIEGKGAIQVDYTRPIRGGMKAYVQLFHGYGENIQNYNHEDTNIGIGLMFNDFSGL